MTKEDIDMIKSLQPELFDEIKGSCLRCTIWLKHNTGKVEERLYDPYFVDPHEYKDWHKSHIRMLDEVSNYLDIKAHGQNIARQEALADFQELIERTSVADSLLDELVAKTILRHHLSSNTESMKLPEGFSDTTS